MSTLAGTAAALLVGFEGFVLAYFAFAGLWYLVLLASATLEMRQLASGMRGSGRARLLVSPLAPGISVLAAVRNERDTVVDRVAALLALHYPNLEVIVVDDGSDDDTLRVLGNHFDLVPVHPIYRRSIVTGQVRALHRSAVYPNLVVVEKARGGTADALNAGLNIASRELVCSIDSSLIVESDALQKLIHPFLESDAVLAASGPVRIANDGIQRGGRIAEARVPRHPLAGLQAIEHLRAFTFGRLGWNRLGGNLVLSGALGLFRRAALIDCGGWGPNGTGDVGLLLRLRRRGHESSGARRVVFVPDPVAWSHVATDSAALGELRGRRHSELADALWSNRALLFNPRYGALGLVVMPYILVMELLAPVVELLGVLGLALGLATGVLDAGFAALFLLVTCALGAVLSVFTLAMDELSFQRYPRLSDRWRLVQWALLEPIGYRQLTVFWRLLGFERWLRERRRHARLERRAQTAASVVERKRRRTA